ncbi:hypothetical protein [Paenarthrobacter ilicis]|uniref:Uncharacterized protein n=1 Tax=Paenarthrobacter ilicis TaxID=43665 RepID=A0ABX0TGR7_9MICC|nr:hypothetical protein [Paenarthrobacter ilicis]MBM7791675.1 hypothetical protein [Paenarthrobacter ilicis]NIJ01699.1 hypothetical protein [Paenarthrobacter ilicis]
MKFSKTSAALFTIGTAAVVSIGVGVSPALAGEQRSIAGTDLVPVLATAQIDADLASADKLGKAILAHVDKDSVRVIAVDDKAIYSSALDHSGREVCLIVQTNTANNASTASCIAVEKFVHSGLTTMASGEDPDSKVVAHLVPADVDTSALMPVTAKRSAATPNQSRSEGTGQLVLQRPNDGLPAVSVLPVEGKEDTFTLVKFPE